MAHRQGPKAVEFVQAARQDEDRLYNMLSSYNEACPEASEHHPGKKRGTWSCVKYMERVTAASGLVSDALGEMMWERLWMEFSATVRGGRRTEEAAMAKWQEWAAQVQLKNPEILHDYKGPDGKLRIWVKTADQLIYRSTWMKEKSIECEGDAIKKATDEDIEKMKPAIMTGHNVNMNFDGMAATLVKNGQDTFQASDGFIMDILELQPDMDVDEEDHAAPASSDETKKDEPEKPKIWVDRDRVVSSSYCAAKSQADLFAKKGEEQLSKQLQAEKELLAELDEDMKEHFAGELKMLRVRLEALDLCFKQKDPELIKHFIGRFSPVASPGDDVQLAAGKLELGSCPPCELYAKLKPIPELFAACEKYHSASLPKHIKDQGPGTRV